MKYRSGSRIWSRSKTCGKRKNVLSKVEVLDSCEKAKNMHEILRIPCTFINLRTLRIVCGLFVIKQINYWFKSGVSQCKVNKNRTELLFNHYVENTIYEPFYISLIHILASAYGWIRYCSKRILLLTDRNA